MKYIRVLYTLVMLGAVVMLPAQGGQENFKIVKGSNGQSYLLAHAADKVIYTDVYFRIGTAYETDSLSGLCVMLRHVIDANVKAAISGRSIRYSSEVTPTQFGFHFESGRLDEVLPIIMDQIINTPSNERDVKAAADRVGEDLDSLSADAEARTELSIKRYLWGNDIRKLDVYGDRRNYTKLTALQLNQFRDRYFLPINNTVIVTGNISDQAVLDALQSGFTNFRRTEFNPELITHVIDFKPSVYSIQLLCPRPGGHMISVTYQQPGARQDRQGTYSAYMLAALFNDPQSKPVRALEAGGILTNVKATYECNNFQGSFRLYADVPSDRFQDAFQIVDSTIVALCRKDYLSQADLNAEHQRISDEFNQLRTHTHTFMTQVAKYRFSDDDYYFSSLADSITSVDLPSMRRYLADYFIDHTGVKCVYSDTAALNMQPLASRYYEVNDSVKEIAFRYPQNVTDIDSAGYRDLQRLIQWLKINPDIHVQVNGYADKGEFDKAYDTTVINFIRNTPTFRKAMPDHMQARYLRIEMMRAMKIAKALYEAGITDDRITGTSMSFSSEDDQQAAANRKCTVTLEKIRPHMSLYEYHFGHKKDEVAPVSGR
ncbi:MAG: insulinase family protein [Bacteroidetes bacterium]|nr:insulinase family protein [Bacteroidota bacterium]